MNKSNLSMVNSFQKSMSWLEIHSNVSAGIQVSSNNINSYPEVTGYFIPTLIKWNMRNNANRWGQWLLSCQHNDGYWSDAGRNRPYAFDTGQIIKGLQALAKITDSEDWDEAIERACDWMCSCVTSTGAPDVPDVKGWGDIIPLGILLYAFQAVREAGIHYGIVRWSETSDKLIAWFLRQPGLTEFTHLSHFHAYILEALCDLGYYDRAREAMDVVAKLQRNSGAIPGFPDVRWVCSTGLFQYAIIWYKLGEREKGDKAFTYAAKLQNESGGWYGSYGWFAKYFPKSEISWAIKYFLDALELRLVANFEYQSAIFCDIIDSGDGRYQILKNNISKTPELSILDAGCGKGRYLRNLIKDFPGAKLHGVDLSKKVMASIPAAIKTVQGSLLCLPYPDNYFDLVYCIEALEHAVHIDGALRELSRVLVPGGVLLIIDKNKKYIGRLRLPDWEQWFDTEGLAQDIKNLGFNVRVVEGVPYDNHTDQLFTAWIATKQVTAA